MADTSGFTQFVPGFDFLQSLVKNAGSALPNMGQWVAPTLSLEEIEKRIHELKTVQFWLEQNARLLAATIQALEVQRMTLATLKTMNVRMGDLRDSLTLHVPGAAAAAAAEPEAAAQAPEAAAAASGPGRPAVDPMQWWGALTQQFSQLAASALKESPAVGRQAADDLPGAPAQTPPAGAPTRAAEKSVARKPPAVSTAAKKQRAAPKA